MQNIQSKTAPEDKDRWATPANIYHGALAYFKYFCAISEERKYALDVCASADNAKHKTYFNEQSDGLRQSWSVAKGGVAWCNPPYSRGSKEKFISKAIAEMENDVQTIMLLPSDTSAQWFKLCVEHAFAIAFVTGGRISFINASTGERNKGNNVGSMLVLFKKRTRLLQTLYFDRNALVGLGERQLEQYYNADSNEVSPEYDTEQE